MAHNIPLEFKIYDDAGTLVRTESLTQDIIKVGKLQSSHLRLEDENVSRMHAVIEVAGPGEVFVIDLGSASGTIVNDKKVNKAQLKSGDSLQFGSMRVEVTIGGAASAKAAPPPVATAPAAPPPKAPGPGAMPPPASPPPKKTAKPKPNPFAAKNPFGRASAKKPLPNPFAPPPSARGTGEVDESDPEKVAYGIVASGPPVDPNEVEGTASALEVMVMWGERSVLHVDHLKPARSFYIGEPEGKEEVDYLMSPDIIGTQRMPICISVGSAVAVVFPQGAEGEVTIGDSTQPIESINLSPCPEVPGAQQYPVPPDASVKMKWKGFTFIVKPVREGKKVGGAFSVDWVPLAYMAGVATLVGILGLVWYFSPPTVSALNTDVIDPNSRLAQFIIEPDEEPEPEEEDAGEEGGEAEGEAAQGEEGAMGDEASERTDNRAGIQGDESQTVVGREEQREAAANTGIVSALSSVQSLFTGGPTSPFGADQAIGGDDATAVGALMGGAVGGNFGMGGLGLAGSGRGGGGTGFGTLGTGRIGTGGRGGGGSGGGPGHGNGGGLGGRPSARPRIRPGSAAVRGSLSADVIRRVVRRHLAEVRHCYEGGLVQQPDLAGRVTIRWIISSSGSVTASAVANSTLRNGRVESCVARAVRRWAFPSPDGGGVVSVTYPFTLQSS